MKFDTFEHKSQIEISKLTKRGMIIQLELLEENKNLKLLENVYHIIDEPVSMDENNQYRITVKGMDGYLYLTKRSDDGIGTDCIYTVYKINKVIETKDNLGYDDFIIEIQLLSQNLEEFGIKAVLKGLCRAFDCELRDLNTVLKLNKPLFSKKVTKNSMVRVTVKPSDHQEKYISKESYQIYKQIQLMLEEFTIGNLYPTLEKLDELLPIIVKYFPIETQNIKNESVKKSIININKDQIFDINKISSKFTFDTNIKECGFIQKEKNN